MRSLDFEKNRSHGYAFGVKVKLLQNQSFKPLQRDTPPKGILAQHQSDANVIFGYSLRLRSGVQHRRNARGLKAGKQNLHVAAAGQMFPPIGGKFALAEI